jgi:hypothetical protein
MSSSSVQSVQCMFCPQHYSTATSTANHLCHDHTHNLCYLLFPAHSNMNNWSASAREQLCTFIETYADNGNNVIANLQTYQKRSRVPWPLVTTNNIITTPAAAKPRRLRKRGGKRYYAVDHRPSRTQALATIKILHRAQMQWIKPSSCSSRFAGQKEDCDEDGESSPHCGPGGCKAAFCRWCEKGCLVDVPVNSLVASPCLLSSGEVRGFLIGVFSSSLSCCFDLSGRDA